MVFPVNKQVTKWTQCPRYMQCTVNICLYGLGVLLKFHPHRQCYMMPSYVNHFPLRSREHQGGVILTYKQIFSPPCLGPVAYYLNIVKIAGTSFALLRLMVDLTEKKWWNYVKTIGCLPVLIYCYRIIYSFYGSSRICINFWPKAPLKSIYFNQLPICIVKMFSFLFYNNQGVLGQKI